MRIKTSHVWKITRDSFQEVCNNSNFISDLCRRLFINPNNGSRQTVEDRIKFEGINLDQLNKNKIASGNLNIRKGCNLDSVLVENSTYSRSSLKKRLIRNGILEYKCFICGITEWNSKSLSLQLDHKNGKQTDNRLENLRLLCPNCHSQTDTYAGKKKPKKDKIHKDHKYGMLKTILNTKEICNQKNTNRTRKFEITKEELSRLIQIMPMTSIGEIYGVSDNAIRKRCKVLNIEIPSRKSKKNKIQEINSV